jgi:hypothetical protein
VRDALVELVGQNAAVSALELVPAEKWLAKLEVHANSGDSGPSAELIQKIVSVFSLISSRL